MGLNHVLYLLFLILFEHIEDFSKPSISNQFQNEKHYPYLCSGLPAYADGL